MTATADPIVWDWDPDPARLVLFDLETQSAASLRDLGSRAYLADGTTRLISAVFLLPGGDLWVWVPPGRGPAGWDSDPARLWPAGWDRAGYALRTWGGEGPPPPVAAALAAGWTFAAHNAAGFDVEAWRRLVGGPQPRWYDTLPCARAAGLPGALDALGLRLVGRGKDDGKAALKLLYTAKRGRDGEPVYNVGTAALWRGMLAYNVADVLLLERVHHATADYGEADVLDAHQAIDARGIAVDGPLCERLKYLWAELQGGAADRVREMTEGILTEGNIRSVPQVKKWLASQGLHVESLNRKQLELLYADPDGFFGDVPDGVDLSKVVEVLRARQTACRISTGKIDRLLSARAGADDGRARGILLYHGAHTGRWSGRGFQPHNLARGVADLDVEALLTLAERGELTLDAIRAAVAKCKPVAGLPPTLDDALSTLLRPALRAPDGRTLLIVDYASIEARGIAWVAGQEDLLDVFRTGGDPYCLMASRIFGRTITKKDKDERQIGKITVLGCGYGMGANKYALFCALQRIDLAAAGTSAEACVEAYRDAFPLIAGEARGKGRVGGVWKAYQRAAEDAIKRPGRVFPAGKCEFAHDGNNLRIVLPSGRPLTYRDCRIEPRVPGWAVTSGRPVPPLPSIVYTHTHGYEGTLYGGLIAENVVQALCRDILATALVRCEGDSVATVLHVHDEIVAEADAADQGPALARLAAVMSDPPVWADGFPVGVEGFTCPRYVKGPFKGSWTAEGLDGNVHLRPPGGH